MKKEPVVKGTPDTCDTFCFDEEKVNRIQSQIDNVQGVELLFKALSDSTRLKVAYALTLEKELCVCDVANIIGSTKATASHHLRLLRNMKLAKYRKEGKLVFYSLADEHVHQLISIALLHGASKITVYGEASIEQLEQAGSFDGNKVYPERQRQTGQKPPFWKIVKTLTPCFPCCSLLPAIYLLLYSVKKV